MSLHNEYIPVPYLRIDQNGNIIEESKQAAALFNTKQKKIQDIIDKESEPKFFRHIFSGKKIDTLELNLHTNSSLPELFDVQFSWDPDGCCHLVLLQKNGSNEVIAEKLNSIQQRLAVTDFELFEKKEQLQKAVDELKKLSGPFIPLTKEIAYIPVFGDVEGDKMKIISSKVLSMIYEGEYETVLFDLTPAGEMLQEGVDSLNRLFRMIFLMHTSTICIIGAKPSQVRSLKEFQIEKGVQFAHSLKQLLPSLITQ